MKTKKTSNKFFPMVLFVSLIFARCANVPHCSGTPSGVKHQQQTGYFYSESCHQAAIANANNAKGRGSALSVWGLLTALGLIIQANESSTTTSGGTSGGGY